MALVDGSKTLKMTSEESFQFDCDPCNYDGTKKEAKFYCLQCKDYLCETCYSFHKKLSSTRNHQVVPVSMPGSMKPPKGETTETHENTRRRVQCFCNRKHVTHYCKDHEKIICTECHTLQHRNCRSLTIGEASSELEKSQDEPTKQAMNTLKEKLDILRLRRQKDLESLNEQTIECRKSLEAFNKEMIQKVETMMKTSLSEIDSCNSAQKQTIEEHLQVCDVALNRLNAAYSTYEDALKSGEKENIFIQTLLFKKTTASVKTALSVAEKAIRPPRVSFQCNKTLKVCCLDTRSLGFINSIPIIADMEIKSKEILDVKFPGDRKEPWITGSAFMSNGELVLCDRNNCSLKLLNASLTAKEQIPLPSTPRAMALMQNEDVVVTLPEKKSLVFVKMLPKLQMGAKIPLDQVCLGVAVKDELIYISFETGEIRIIDVAGMPQRNIYSLLRFKDPYYISVLETGVLFISENEGNSVRAFEFGEEIYSYKNPQMVGPNGMLIDGGENAFVCARISNTLHVIDKVGKLKKILLSERDGLNEPYTISFRPFDNTLIVGGKAKK